MNGLSKKSDEFIKEMKLSLNRKEVVQLMAVLMEHYDISAEELKVNASVSVSDNKTEQSSLSRSAPPITGQLRILSGVGVVLPSNKVLYYDGSQNKGERSQAYHYMREKLAMPKGYAWHIMSRVELAEIRSYQRDIDKLLSQFDGGVTMFADDDEYILEDNRLKSGYVRYLADLN